MASVTHCVDKRRLIRFRFHRWRHGLQPQTLRNQPESALFWNQFFLRLFNEAIIVSTSVWIARGKARCGFCCEFGVGKTAMSWWSSYCEGDATEKAFIVSPTLNLFVKLWRHILALTAMLYFCARVALSSKTPVNAFPFWVVNEYINHTSP